MNLPKGISTERRSIFGNPIRINPKKKLTDDQVREIRASKGSSALIAKKFGVSGPTICAIRNGKARRCVK